jgi:AraC-like DNA-binding protein
VLVFDSASVGTRERHSAMVDTITSAAHATFMTPGRGGANVHLRMHVWDLGGVEVVDTRCSAHTLQRSARQASREDEPTLAITCGMKGRGVHRQHDRDITVQPSAVWATDLSQPYVHHVSDTWTTTAKIPARLLGVPHDLATPALGLVSESPLAPLFSHHVAQVRHVVPHLNDAAAAALGTATVALARALVASVSGHDRLGREALDDVLLLRVQAYVREHLSDPRLDPRTIAAANHVSIRQLYKTCAQADLQLEQWIIRERLARAHEELARTASSRTSVTAVAHRWGFASASHFARRFRSAYGVSPREWQAMNRARGNSHEPDT